MLMTEVPPASKMCKWKGARHIAQANVCTHAAMETDCTIATVHATLDKPMHAPLGQ